MSFRDPIAEFMSQLETQLRDDCSFDAVGDHGWTQLAFVQVTPYESATEDWPAALITSTDFADEQGNRSAEVYVVLYVPCDDPTAAYYDLLELAFSVRTFIAERGRERRFQRDIALRNTIRGLPASFNPQGDAKAPPTHLVLNLTLQLDWEGNDLQ